MSYIKQILDYFFKHDVSDDLKSRVYSRMFYPEEDKERDNAVKDLWDNIKLEDSQEWEEAYNRVQSVIDKDNDKKRRFRLFYTFGRIAAVWFVPFVMLCTSAYMYYEVWKGSKSVNTEVTYVQYYAEAGKREQIMLPDSTTVWLNSGSILIYPSTFSSAERGVYLMGEGFFDVKRDEEHPFVVNTRFLRMQVLGTTFNVSAYPDEEQVKTTLETGAIKVNVNNDTVSYYLNPNNQLVYTPATNKVEQFDVRASDYSDWRNGGLFFDNTDFDNAMKVIERVYDVKIHIRTSVYSNQKIYVHFNKDETLENIFHILKIMIPQLEYKIKDNSVYIE